MKFDVNIEKQSAAQRGSNLEPQPDTTNHLFNPFTLCNSGYFNTYNKQRSKFVSRLEQDSGVQKTNSPNLVSTLIAGISLRTVKLN